MFLKRSLTILALTLLTGLSVAQQVGGNVTLAITEEPDTLDPQKTSTAVTGTILEYLGDTLITKSLDGSYTGALASAWSPSKDGLTWTFTLKSGVTFHDGTPLTAESVKASIERALDPKTQSPIASSLFSGIETITVNGPTKLSITLKEPFSPFLDNLADPRADIVNVGAATKEGRQFGRAPILSGPWKVKTWRSGDSIVLERNPDYNWGPSYAHKGAPYLNTLTFRVIPEAATQVAAFEANEVQVLNVPPTDVKRLQDTGQYKFEEFLRKGVGLFMEFNVQKAPFDDPLVREALNHAIDKEVLVQVALSSLGEPADGVLPPSIQGYWDGISEYTYDYDLDKAHALLTQAGYAPNAEGVLERDGQPLSFTLYTAPIDTWTRSAQIVQGMLSEFGIQVKIQTFEFGTLLEKLKAGEQQADFMGYTYTSPDIVYLWFHSSNIGTGLAHSHHKDPKLDALIVQSRRETDETVRNETYAEIQRYINDEALWVPLWTNTNYIAVQPEVKGAKLHSDGYLSLLDAYVDE